MTALPAQPTNLRAAYQLAAHHYRVLPIKPGAKHPPIPAWQDAATDNYSTIRNWWENLYRGHGIGIATGHLTSGQPFFVLDIDEHGNTSGSDTLHDLTLAHGELPDTIEVITGSGGRHLYFASPTMIRNDAGRKLGPGIDIRGEGGQVLAPPTIHPNGNTYEWVEGHAPWQTELAEAPQWLITLLTAEPTPTTTPTPAPTTTRDQFLRSDSIADKYNDNTTWADLLTRDGWQATHTDTSGVTYWVRPGKTAREGTSATTGWNGLDILKVFTTSLPWLPEGAYSRFQYHAHRHHNGDMSAAARHLLNTTPQPSTTTQNGTVSADEPYEPTTWEDHDLTGWLDGTGEQLEPTILERTDGQALLYPGRINLLFGESGSGKSWIALATVAQHLANQQHVAYIDLEDHPRSIVKRLTALGTDPDDIRTYFHYKQPSIASKHYALEAVKELVDAANLDLIVVDSYGEALALFGVDQNDDHGVAGFTQSVLRPWTRLGAGIILLDHIPKSEDGPRLFAIGSQRKRAAVDGAAYRINQVRSFAKGVDGKIAVITAKDRGGTYPIGSTAAEIDVTTSPDGDTIKLTIAAPEGRDAQGRPNRPTHLMEKVSRYLERQVGQVSRIDIKKAVPGKTDYKMKALDILVEEGYVTALEVVMANRKPGTMYVIHTPFREGADNENTLTKITATPVTPQRPRGSGSLSQPPKKDSDPSDPPYTPLGGHGVTVSGSSEAQRPHSDPEQDNLDKYLF